MKIGKVLKILLNVKYREVDEDTAIYAIAKGGKVLAHIYSLELFELTRHENIDKETSKLTFSTKNKVLSFTFKLDIDSMTRSTSLYLNGVTCRHQEFLEAYENFELYKRYYSLCRKVNNVKSINIPLDGTATLEQIKSCLS